VGIVTSAVLDALTADGNEDWPDNDVVLYEPCESELACAYAYTNSLPQMNKRSCTNTPSV
jgi:hypothetical protein